MKVKHKILSCFKDTYLMPTSRHFSTLLEQKKVNRNKDLDPNTTISFLLLTFKTPYKVKIPGENIRNHARIAKGVQEE
jgi:hypothetical protein